MVLFKLHTVTDICKGQFLQGNPNEEVESVLTDSRTYHSQSKTLFVAIKGTNNNANLFVQDLYDQGQRLFLLSENVDLSAMPEAHCILVSDGLKALQLLAAHHRKSFNYPVVAITGSNGKTIVKEWLYHLLKDHHNICRSPKSYNSQLGVALSLLNMRPEHTVALIEAGISQPGEMVHLQKMIQPTLGILTHLGTAHQHNFSDSKELEEEKMTLFKDGIPVIDFRDNGQHFKTINEGQFQHVTSSLKLQIPYKNVSSISNAQTAYRAAIELGIKANDLEQAMTNLPSIAMRLERLKGTRNCLLINDAYNSDISGLEIALDFLLTHTADKKILVLSDIQLDRSVEEKAYAKVFQLINQYNLDGLIAVGPKISTYSEQFQGSLLGQFNSTLELSKSGLLSTISNSCILFKGAREFRFEHLIAQLEEKPHNTYLEINLTALEHNFKTYQQEVPHSKIMCMVKAMAYGTGSKEVYQTLEKLGADYLGVAYASEGQTIREADVQLPIMVMNSDHATFQLITDLQLEPVIYDLKQMDDFIRHLILNELTDYPVHIELDTGMKRLGFSVEQVPEMMAVIKTQPEIRVKSIFSHLAGADTPHLDGFTNGQINSFSQATHNIQEALPYPILKHICNSSGIERFPLAHFDMVRLGIGLYGLGNLPELKMVSTLKTTIVQIKDVKENEGIGYGHTNQDSLKRLIGILPIGYADGLSRLLSNEKGTLYHQASDQLIPIVGKVCMDMCMVDLSHVNAQVGDVVEVFGDNRNIEELAQQMETIPYEVLTSVSDRIKRIYVSE